MTDTFVFINPILIADQESYNDARALLATDKNILDAARRDRFMEDYSPDFSLTPIYPDGDPNKPILIDDKRQALLWCDPDEPDNLSAMFAVIFELSLTHDGQVKRSVAQVIAGEEFQGVVLYRRDRPNCCPRENSALSALVLMQDGHGNIGWDMRDSIYTAPTCTGLFNRVENAVIRSDHQIAHILQHARGAPCTHDHKAIPHAIPEAKLNG